MMIFYSTFSFETLGKAGPSGVKATFSINDLLLSCTALLALILLMGSTQYALAEITTSTNTTETLEAPPNTPFLTLTGIVVPSSAALSRGQLYWRLQNTTPHSAAIALPYGVKAITELTWQSTQKHLDQTLPQQLPCQAQHRPSRRLTLAPNDCVFYRVDHKRKLGQQWAQLNSSKIWQHKASDWLPTFTRSHRTSHRRFRETPGNIALTLYLPSDLKASSPWEQTHEEKTARHQQGNNAYEALIRPSPRNFDGLLLVGDLSQRQIMMGNSHINVVYTGEQPQQFEKLISWLRRNLRALISASHSFPSERLQVILVPVDNYQTYRRHTSPVPFGHVIRAGDQTVRFFVYERAPLQDLLDDWTAAHEFSHLLLPYLGLEGRWVSEGFASYYQNILMANMGLYKEEEAWQRLLAGITRARRVSPKISPNDSPDVGMAKARMMIYWAGAAFALLADMEIRQRSSQQISQHASEQQALEQQALEQQASQQQTLASVLGQFHQDYPHKVSWELTHFFTTLDGYLDQPIFMPLYHQYADRPGVPNITPLLQQLGVKATPNEEYRHVALQLNNRAPLANLRLQLMSPPSSLATPAAHTQRSAEHSDKDTSENTGS
ncbi:hypothetical protein [Marinibactrum halimedae]|uniref:Peptidase M61 catalytic domain-containing protein n=1 Tax=Marinibactrum halimedae TaxID=1444977 RepID=A0AA37T7Z3_9GAMM|nr:hypothetical protein [Marinibactrum halimedae]MCD9459250.1 hypothetical protein [Marinibactrum halimedae]GLS27324.1 hypothetical protein GCM10007877_30430 [Marinibactrum halimedae]